MALLDNDMHRDHVDWDQEQEDLAKEKVSVQMENPVPEEEQGKTGETCAVGLVTDTTTLL